ncbi:hypothetical protein E8E95_14715 [Pseudomonas sp. BN414]|nr:hypothetical protein [Pseudomonas sp. BN414]
MVVLGHSLSNVDRDYFLAIVAALYARDVSWTIAVRGE